MKFIRVKCLSFPENDDVFINLNSISHMLIENHHLDSFPNQECSDAVVTGTMIYLNNEQKLFVLSEPQDLIKDIIIF
jgi:hypothetical protein